MCRRFVLARYKNHEVRKNKIYCAENLLLFWLKFYQTTNPDKTIQFLSGKVRE